jgi:uncharacterized protein (DUF486 family)
VRERGVAGNWPSLSRRPTIASMPVWLRTGLLLTIANVFMTFAWYGHLRDLRERPVWVAILVSWGIALLEYCFQVPANRMGFGDLSLGQLKVMQEVITMFVFMGFAAFYFRRPVGMDFFYATLCLCAAAFFVFRGGTAPTE